MLETLLVRIPVSDESASQILDSKSIEKTKSKQNEALMGHFKKQFKEKMFLKVL